MSHQKKKNALRMLVRPENLFFFLNLRNKTTHSTSNGLVVLLSFISLNRLHLTHSDCWEKIVEETVILPNTCPCDMQADTDYNNYFKVYLSASGLESN